MSNTQFQHRCALPNHIFVTAGGTRLSLRHCGEISMPITRWSAGTQSRFNSIFSIFSTFCRPMTSPRSPMSRPLAAGGPACQYKASHLPLNYNLSSGLVEESMSMGFLLISLVGLLVPALATLDESKLKDLSELANIKSAGDALEPSSRNGRLFYISYTSSTTTISTEVALP